MQRAVDRLAESEKAVLDLQMRLESNSSSGMEAAMAGARERESTEKIAEQEAMLAEQELEISDLKSKLADRDAELERLRAEFEAYKAKYL